LKAEKYFEKGFVKFSFFRNCSRTLQTLVENSLENVENKIFELLEMVGEKVVMMGYLILQSFKILTATDGS